MRSPFKFIVSPLGDKYITTKKVADKILYTTASIEHAVDVNRHAVVIATPIHYKGNIKVGDTIILHHNVFRDYYNTSGGITTSPYQLKDNTYLVYEDLIYLHKTNDEWEANKDYCFIRPFKELDKLSNTYKEVELQGIVVYSNHFEQGTVIGFTPESEYEFKIDNEILYRMTADSICLIK